MYCSKSSEDEKETREEVGALDAEIAALGDRASVLSGLEHVKRRVSVWLVCGSGGRVSVLAERPRGHGMPL